MAPGAGEGLRRIERLEVRLGVLGEVLAQFERSSARLPQRGTPQEMAMALVSEWRGLLRYLGNEGTRVRRELQRIGRDRQE